MTFTYDTPRPRPEHFPISPDNVDELPELPEEEPGEWDDPIAVEVEDDDHPSENPAEDEPPGTLDEVVPVDPQSPLPGDKTMESGIPVKEPSPDTTESPE